MSKYEVIVVDDESKDNTIDIAKKYRRVKVFANKHAGPAVQRNFGAKQAKHDIILFIDSDCIVEKDVLKRVEKNFKENIIGVGGVYKTLNNDKIVARYIGHEIAYRHKRSPKETNFLGTYCCAYKKDVFLKFGGFDEKFPIASGEDPELSFRIADAGNKLIIDKKMFVKHPHPEKIDHFIKQQFWRAYWRVLMYKKHPKKMWKSDPYSGLDVLASTSTLGMFFVFLFASLLVQELLYVSLVLLVLFFIFNFKMLVYMAKRELKMILAAPIMLMLRTMSWGLGFVYGQIKLR
jgi:glycosyltransferase involved in cell wall biosynthesis